MVLADLAPPVRGIPRLFRLLALLPDGRILSEVMRTAQIPQGLEIASAGYE